MDINFACAMGPPGGGRNPVTQRLTRHFNFLSFTEMEDASKKKIFSTILGSWMGESRLLMCLHLQRRQMSESKEYIDSKNTHLLNLGCLSDGRMSKKEPGSKSGTGRNKMERKQRVKFHLIAPASVLCMI